MLMLLSTAPTLNSAIVSSTLCLWELSTLCKIRVVFYFPLCLILHLSILNVIYDFIPLTQYCKVLLQLFMIFSYYWKWSQWKRCPGVGSCTAVRAQQKASSRIEQARGKDGGCSWYKLQRVWRKLGKVEKWGRLVDSGVCRTTACRNTSYSVKLYYKTWERMESNAALQQ